MDPAVGGHTRIGPSRLGRRMAKCSYGCRTRAVTPSGVQFAGLVVVVALPPAVVEVSP